MAFFTLLATALAIFTAMAFFTFLASAIAIFTAMAFFTLLASAIAIFTAMAFFTILATAFAIFTAMAFFAFFTTALAIFTAMAFFAFLAFASALWFCFINFFTNTYDINICCCLCKIISPFCGNKASLRSTCRIFRIIIFRAIIFRMTIFINSTFRLILLCSSLFFCCTACFILSTFLFAFESAALLFGLTLCLVLAFTFDNFFDFCLNFRFNIIRNSIIIWMDFTKSEEPMAITAVVDKSGLQRRFYPHHFSCKDITFNLFFCTRFEFDIFNLIPI